MSRRQFLRWTLASLGLGAVGRSSAQFDPAVEYGVKAGLLLQFALVTTWAPEAFADAKAPFVIGIFGADPWQGQLAKKLGGVIKNRKLEVIKCAEAAEAAKCHLLFISKSEKARVEKILDELKDSKVFTVVEGDRAVETDGVINLYLDKTIKFILNEEAAERAKLKMGSELKEYAAKVYRKRRK